MAEGIFRHLVEARGLGHRFRIDSAGTGAWHVGEPPDPRAAATAERRGVALDSRARQVVPEDLEAFDVVIAMDRENLRILRRMADGKGTGDARLHLMRSFDPEGDGEDVPDPYYGGPGGFEDVYEMILRSCETLLDQLTEDS